MNCLMLIRVALRWQDVDLEQSLYGWSEAFSKPRPVCGSSRPRRSTEGAITLPAFVVSELKAHWKGQQEGPLALGLGKAPPDGLVFARFDGSPQEWAECAKALALGVTFHALRHMHASQLIAAGLDVLTVSRRLGHGSPTITLGVYGHLFINTDTRAAQALDSAFGAAG